MFSANAGFRFAAFVDVSSEEIKQKDLGYSIDSESVTISSTAASEKTVSFVAHFIKFKGLALWKLPSDTCTAIVQGFIKWSYF